MFSTFRGVHTLIFSYVPHIVIDVVHEEPANFYREKRRFALKILLFWWVYLSSVFHINMWKSDHMKARNSIKNDCGRFVENQLQWPLC